MMTHKEQMDKELEENEISVGSDWWEAKEGDNKLRIMSKYVLTPKHFDKSKFLGYCGGKTCTHCQGGNKKKASYILYVLDRKDNKLKPATFGYMITKQWITLADSEDWSYKAYPMPYDVNIVRTGTGLDTEYVVHPSPLEQIEEKYRKQFEKLESIETLASNLKKKDAEGDNPDEDVDDVITGDSE